MAPPEAQDYYEYGLKQRKSTGKVDTSKVYTSGRYMLGPDYTFLKYRADAHELDLTDLAVFSSSVGFFVFCFVFGLLVH